MANQLPSEVRLRPFAGAADYPQMLAVIEASKVVDRIERSDTLESLAHSYSRLSNCDPYQDMIMAEAHGELLGYGRCWWLREHTGIRSYVHFGWVRPDWRHRGIGSAILLYLQKRLRVIALEHPTDGPRYLESLASDSEVDSEALLQRDGYIAVRHSFDMVRPTLDNLPVFELPPGLIVRPVQPEHYRLIWEADAEAIERILSDSQRIRPRRPGAEVSLELNPKTADLRKMRDFRAAGCNRLSIGVQTLDPDLLAELGRAHDPAEALQALSWALETGFEKLSIDLMYGLPKQELGQIEATLAQLEKYPLRHLSAYELIVEEDTPFYERQRRNRLPLPSEPEVEAMRRRLEHFASAKGMQAYEISNYAAPGAEARHNWHYWCYDSFIGLGAGAVSFLRFSELNPELPPALASKRTENGFALRLTNPRSLSLYQDSAAAWDKVEVEVIDLTQAQSEFMMMGLRKREGVAYADFEACFGSSFPKDFAAIVRRGEERAWLRAGPQGCRFTEAGMALSNEFLQEFF